MERAASHLKKIVVRDSAIDAVCHGADLAAGGILQLSEGIKRKDTLAIMTLKGELVAAGEALATTTEIDQADKGIMVNIKKGFYGTRNIPYDVEVKKNYSLPTSHLEIKLTISL